MKSLRMELEQLENELEEVENELMSLPSGFLAKNKGCYSHRVGKKDKGITKNQLLIKQLCRRRYLVLRKNQLTINIKAIRECLEKLVIDSPQQIVENLSFTYQELPKENFYHPSVEKFLNATHQKNPYPMTQSYTSTNGTILRSKSELLIANKLEHYGIPYRYEIAMKIGNQTKYPDFIIKHPFTGRTIIWEHFGALNQQGYEQAMNEKMTLYLKHDIQPIYTFEADIQDRRRLDGIIAQLRE